MSKESKIHSQSVSNVEGYDRWSQSYDTDANSTIAADEVAFSKALASLKGLRVLEVGCGTGRHTQRLIAAGNRVVALDASAGMLRVAQAKLAGASVEWIEGDFLQHQFGEQHFDAIVLSLVLEHFADLPRFFQRAAELIEVGGQLWISEIHPERTSKGSQAKFLTAQGDVFLSSYPHTTETIRCAASDAGLTLQICEDVVATPELIAEDSSWEKYRGHRMIQIWKWTR